MNLKRDHYKTLGVSRDASLEAVKQAHRRRAKETHTDLGGDNEEFLAVQRAYETLSDQEARERYDRTGEDAGEKSVEQQAAELLSQIVIQAVQSCPDPDTHDVITFVREQVEDQLQEQRKNVAEMPVKAKKFRMAAGRFTRKEGDNYLRDSLLQAADNTERMAAHIEKRLEIVQEVLNQLNWFTYKTDEAPVFTRPNSPLSVDISDMQDLLERLRGKKKKGPLGGW